MLYRQSVLLLWNLVWHWEPQPTEHVLTIFPYIIFDNRNDGRLTLKAEGDFA